jgi:transglutaminase-like putative cysteine protease
VKYRVRHFTQYDYSVAVTMSHNVVRMRPRDSAVQSCVRHELTLSPPPEIRLNGLDYFGNHAVWFSLQEPHTHLTVSAQSEVEVSLGLRPDISSGPSWEEVRETIAAGYNSQTLLAREFVMESPYVPHSAELAEYALPSFLPGTPFLQCIFDLTTRIRREFKFLPGSTKVGTPVLDVLRARRGVCQDFAHLQLGCLRTLGFAARYVSGYLVTTPPAGKPRLEGADVSHAWISVYTPEFGWIDFDPTNGLMPSDSHITVAWARDYDEVGPVKGIVVGGRTQKLDYSVDVVPVDSF